MYATKFLKIQAGWNLCCLYKKGLRRLYSQVLWLYIFFTLIIHFSGGNEEIEDYGEEFIYTGRQGGLDLTLDRKRRYEQISNQKLEKKNAAIARCCIANFYDKNSADAGDRWRWETNHGG